MKRGTAVLAAALLASPAAAQEPQPAPPATAPTAPADPAASAVGVLLRQAQRWLDQGRPELAASSIERALAAEPRNPEALAMAVRVEAARGNRDASASFLARLRAAGATPDQVAASEGDLRGAAVDRTTLETARRLAREGKSDEAVAQYRAAFGQPNPPSAYAREFYQVLSGTTAGRDAGQAGLGRLAAQPGADERTLLANAEVLTYSPATRADGIKRLAELAARPTIAPDAQRAWKQALTFYDTDPAGIPPIEDYLRRFPGDAEIQKRLEAARAAPAAQPAGPGDDLRRRGFAELETGALRDSAQRFQSALALNPTDADALGGLGIVRLRENKAAEARDLLNRAIAADPAKAGQWKRALDGASYTLELAEARALLRRNDVAGADALLRQAVRREVDDNTDSESMLGEVALRRNDATEAETRFRAALARRPGFAPSITGLSQALRAQGRVAEANALRPPPRPSPPGGGGGGSDYSTDPEVARLRAEAARATDPLTETSLLNTAMGLSPNDPWLRLDLARALRRMGRDTEARALTEELAARSPTPDANYAAALLAQESNRPADAEAFLSRIPPQRRNADMARLAQRVRTQAEIAREAAFLPSAPVEARRQLLLLAARPDPTGGTAADVIRVLGAANDQAGAVEAGRVAEAVNRLPAARIAVAGALLGAGLEAEAAAMAARVEAGPVTPAQQRDLASLRTGTAIRASDRLNEAGDQASAFERLRPALASNPQDPAVELALGRLYAGASRPAEAQRIAEAVLARNPRDAEARRAAVDAAVAAGDRRRAEALANEARAMAPGDSRATLLQARVARGFGDNPRARALLAEASAQREQEVSSTARTPGAPASATANPFVRLGTASAGTAVAVADPVAREIAAEFAQLRAESATRLSAGAIVRVRSGSGGLDKLQEVDVPFEASSANLRIPGRLTVRAVPVILDSGRLDTSNSQALRFGTNALTGTPAASDTTATGVGLNVAYQRGEVFAIDVGTTPLGFRTTNVVGGIEVAPRLTENVRLRLKGERRAVLDSLLSYAGERDPGTGTVWGGVTQTGGRIQLEGSAGAGNAYVLGGYAMLDGQNVQRNNRVEAGAGFSYPVYRSGKDEVRAGLDLVYFAYDHNQRGFTLGQGGYFSPQNFVGINLPVDYRSNYGLLKYHVGATVGFANFREDASPLFPTSASRQAQVEAAAAANPLIPTRNLGQNKSGVTGGVRVDLEYPLTESLALIGAARYDRAADFQETRVSVRLENRF